MYVDAVRGMKDEKTVRGILTKPNAMTAKLEDSLASGHIVDAKTGESIKPNAKDAIQYAEDVKAGVQMSPAKPMTGVEEFDTHVFDPLIHTKDGKTWIEKGQARDFIRTLLTAERHLVRETMMGGQKAVLEQIFALINSDKSHVDRIEDVVNLLEKKLRSIEDTAWLA